MTRKTNNMMNLYFHKTFTRSGVYKQLYTILFLLISSGWAMGQTGEVNGTVTTSTGEALKNANVMLQGTGKGTVTDSKGFFTLNSIAPKKYELVISSIGYETVRQQITVSENKATELSIKLISSVEMLGEVAVKGQVFKKQNETVTVNELSLDQIRLLNITEPTRIIQQIPGVDLGAYRQGGVADVFSIRGFGGGGHEGQAGVQLDGISLNEAEGHADGYADMNILIPLNIQKVQVYKGPSSVLYGRFAEGGTIAYETRKGGGYTDIQLTGGSFNTFDAQVALGQPIQLKSGKLNSNFAFQIFNTAGYSENSDYLKGNLSGRLAYQVTKKTDVALTLNAHSSEWGAPGYISEAQINDLDRRDQQAPNAENDGGSKVFASQRLDVNHTINKNIRLLLFGYSVQQNFTRFAKFGFDPGGQSERFNTREVYSAGGSLNGTGKLGKVGVDWVAGAEFYDETTARKRWNTSNRVRMDQVQQRTFSVQSISAFAQGEFSFSRYFRPSVGLRYDTYLGDFVNEDPGQTGFTTDMNNLANVAPKVGVRSTLFRGFDLRANVSNGFSLPNSTTKYDPDLNLEPVQLWQYEAGINYTYNQWFELDAAAYVLNTSREIMENPPGSGNLINAGMTQRRGLETRLELKPLPGFAVLGSFTYMQTEIMENTNADLVGKELSNIPATISFVNVVYTLKSGLGAMVRVRDVGEYATDGGNTGYYDGYTVGHLMVFYNFDGRSMQRGRVFVEVNNFTNENYAEAVFGGAGAQSFAPAPLANFTAGVSFNF